MNEHTKWNLPELKDGQSWCCGNGCGDCKPVKTKFEYSRTETPSGKLIESKTEDNFVSDCCGSELMLWDSKKQDTVGYEVWNDV